MRKVTGLLIIFLLSSQFACTHQAVVLSPANEKIQTKIATVETSSWWRYAVHIKWPDSAPPVWPMDLYLADQLFAPVLEARAADMSLWRFHRRAIRDASGHRFSLLFYCNPVQADKIYKALDRRYQFLTAVGMTGIDRIRKSDVSNPVAPGLETASDNSWRVEIQRSWPYFINGASKSWLDLVQRLASPLLSAEELPNFQSTLAVYLRVSNVIDQMWREQGAHAYLHHLNALFGYKGTIVTESRLMRF